MANCKFCGKPAGLLQHEHRQCAARHRAGREQMIQCVRIAVSAETPRDQLRRQLQRIAEGSCISVEQTRESLIEGWEQMATYFVEDGDLDPDEESHLLNFLDRNALQSADVDKRGAFQRMMKGIALRAMLEGRVPDLGDEAGHLPFNFQKSETLLWVFHQTRYLEDRTRRHYVGGHHGVSLRITKGVYYRVGGFRGRPVDTTERAHVDSGTLAVTTKHLYFAGASRSFRIRHDRIVSYAAYSDGFGVHRDAASAKPQIFVTGDGWFSYNVAVNAASFADRMAEPSKKRQSPKRN